MAIARVFAGRPEEAKSDESNKVPTMAVMVDAGYMHMLVVIISSHAGPRRAGFANVKTLQAGFSNVVSSRAGSCRSEARSMRISRAVLG